MRIAVILFVLDFCPHVSYFYNGTAQQKETYLGFVFLPIC